MGCRLGCRVTQWGGQRSVGTPEPVCVERAKPLDPPYATNTLSSHDHTAMEMIAMDVVSCGPAPVRSGYQEAEFILLITTMQSFKS